MRGSFLSILTFILISLLMPASAEAQEFPETVTLAPQDIILALHRDIPTLYNPAFAGSSGMLRIRGAGRLQWTGTEGNPHYLAASADMPVEIGPHRAGAAISAFINKISPLKEMAVSVKGSYTFRAGTHTRLTIGISGAYLSARLATDSTSADGATSEKSRLKGSGADFAIGALLTTTSWHMSLSASHLLSPRVRLKSAGNVAEQSTRFEMHLKPTLYFGAGGNIKLQNTLFILQPSLLMASDFDNFNAIADLRASFKETIWAGAGYRWKDALCFSAGVNIKGFFLGYAYDLPVASRGSMSEGSHEIVAGYSVRLDSGKKKRFRQKSVRILH